MTRSVEPFEPLSENSVSIYSCGPTVYHYLHIGNWSAYIYWDVLVRTLELQGLKVKWYMNITDVGHLVSDDDSGEDKLEKGAQREGKTAWEVAEFYTEDFLQGLDKLNISIPKDHLVKATDNIDIQIKLISKLEELGYTYKIADGIYFDSSRLADYGKLARLDITGLQAGARVDIKDKKNPTDFALWKFSPKDSKRDMEWESPWGTGFPGWHIECSAMAMHYLGQTLDIHTGGIDHIPVHHTNEIAQSETATGETFVNYWLHNNFMNIDDNKVSKSLGNVILLADIEKKHHSLKAYRLMVLQSHFRTQSNFTWEILASAEQRLLGWQAVADMRFQLSKFEENSNANTDTNSEQLQKNLESIKHQVLECLSNDLDTPAALVTIEKGIDKIQKSTYASTTIIEEYFQFVSNALGINLLVSKDIDQTTSSLINKRQTARDSKDWKTADQLRSQLKEQGILLRDYPNHQLWSRDTIQE